MKDVQSVAISPQQRWKKLIQEQTGSFSHLTDEIKSQLTQLGFRLKYWLRIIWRSQMLPVNHFTAGWNIISFHLAAACCYKDCRAATKTHRRLQRWSIHHSFQWNPSLHWRAPIPNKLNISQKFGIAKKGKDWTQQIGCWGEFLPTTAMVAGCFFFFQCVFELAAGRQTHYYSKLF